MTLASIGPGTGYALPVVMAAALWGLGWLLWRVVARRRRSDDDGGES
ncbi:MAG: hypothetical protein H6825_14820 [Planctomycetes bacterium]|nr:hypothetical protein [Planctomycetota bacterium]